MAISDLRFPKRIMVKNMIERCELAGAIIDMDKDGYFVHSFTMPDWLAALPTAEQINASKPQVEQAPKKAPKKAPARTIKNGACDKIREWARANPEATKADGVKQFPELNPSTIAIQMRKVRLGQV